MVSAIFTFPYAKSTGMGLDFKQGATWQRFAIATAIALIATVALLKLWGLVLMAGLWLIVFGIASYVKSRLGGLTGDAYGAINELAEVLMLLILIFIVRL
jgi:adenosylcobinamide-GDP ribazoletransferase